MSAAPTAMVVTDLDGTLLDRAGRLSDGNRATLEALGRSRVLRVVATGRSLWSASRALPADLPLDYLVFASGAGVLRWCDRRLLHARDLAPEQALGAAAELRALALDFMLHAPVPDNHRFWYHRAGPGNADFERRLRRYRGHCEPWPEYGPEGDRFSQLLAIEGSRAASLHRRLAQALRPLNVIRTTSPLDHVSSWYEIFPEGVSKATGAAWLLGRYGLERDAVLAVGNDFNDLDLLEWAPCAKVVANAPPTLRQRFACVPDNDRDGFSVAVQDWLGC